MKTLSAGVKACRKIPPCGEIFIGGAIMDCKNCCYFGFSGSPDWRNSEGKEIEHCLFRELRGDYDTAPCDEPSYETPSDYYGNPWDYDEC